MSIELAEAERVEKVKVSEFARCMHCKHPASSHVMVRDYEGIERSTALVGEGDCLCGCTHFEQRVKDPLAGREWIVQVEFYLKNRWVKGEARVRAMGQIGAIAKGVREVKKDLVKPRARVSQVKVTLIPIAGSGKKKGS